MSYVTVKCNNCGSAFDKKVKDVNVGLRKGHKFYCSSECQGKSKTILISCTCAMCGKTLLRSSHSIRASKSGRVFCNSSCSASYNNISRMGEKHPNFKGGRCSYRSKAIRNSNGNARCAVCTYDIIECLIVHHKDMNRSNNDYNNLIILCPNHHAEIHRGIRDL